MRAVWLREFGPPGALTPGEAPEPNRRGTASVIDVEYANITFVETQVRAGPRPVPGPAPHDPGQRRGRHARTAAAWSPRSTAAVATRSARSRASCSTSPTTSRSTTPSRCSPTAARRRSSPTRRHCSRASASSVLAAAGGVGTLLVQLAHRAGATVIGAASTEAKRRRAASLGAAETIGYDELKEGQSLFRFVFDGVGGAGRPGRVRGAGAGRADALLRARQRGVGGHQRRGGRGARASRSCAPGRPERQHTERALTAGLTPIIGQRFPLEQAADAHAAMEARATIGKTLLEKPARPADAGGRGL